MDRFILKLKRVDEHFVSFASANVHGVLRVSIGLIYLVFGLLKFFPNYSPAEELAGDTIALMTFGFIQGPTALILLAVLECIIGVGLVVNYRLLGVIRLTLAHMFCTFLPLIILPEVAFTNEPYSLSLVGQYIFKNLIIVSALLVLYCKEKGNC